MRYQQLGLFTRKQMNAMRDRTLARNWSPEMDAFRREHARRRAWGLAQRHGFKLLWLRRQRDGPAQQSAPARPRANLAPELLGLTPSQPPARSTEEASVEGAAEGQFQFRSPWVTPKAGVVTEAEPEAASHETAAPGTEISEIAAPETAVSEGVAAGCVAREGAVPETAASEFVAPRTTAPGTAALEMAASGMVASGVAASGVAASGVAASRMVACGMAAPGMAAFEMAAAGCGAGNCGT